MGDETKSCPQCGEEIKASAIKCRHCGSILDEAAHRAHADGPPSGGKSKDDLRAIARYQRGIIVCILLYLLLVAGQFSVPVNLRPLLGLVFLPIAIGAAVCTFLLSIRVYSTAVGIIVAILTLIPCIGLLALLRINAAATAILKEHGVSVGLVGADASQI